jgi:cell division protein FtsB
MRHRKPSAIYGIVNKRLRLSRERLVLIGLLIAAIWLVWSFAQEVFLSRDLGRQAVDLHQQNAALRTENRGYQRDIMASTSGAAAEEEAREDGYSKPKERLYMVGDSPPPTPGHPPPAAARAAARPARPASHPDHGSVAQRFLGWFVHLVLP